MIDEAIVFLQRHVGRGLRTDPGEPEERVVLPEGVIPKEGMTLKETAVSVLLLNIEEEAVLRPADPFSRVTQDGSRLRVNPEIRLNLHVLFVPNFQSYADSLRYLSMIIGHFQTHRVMNHSNSPDLSARIDQLIVELRTPTFSEQNEIWGSLRIPSRPAALYRVRMIVFQAPPELPAIEIREAMVDLQVTRGGAQP